MGDVKGDGNCLWYSLERLTAQDAKKIKQSSFNRLESLKPAWLQLHEAITPEIWSQLVFQQDQWGEFANEVSVASSSTLLDRCVVVLSDAYITLFARKHPVQEQVVRALVLNLHEQHYSPVLEKLPNESATQLLTQGRSYSPSLLGGGRLVSWNVGSLTLRWQELLSHSWQIACVQETGATLRQQKYLQREAESRNYVAIWGAPTPTGWNRANRLRSQTGTVPGVAIFAPLTMNMRYRAPMSIPGQNLEKRGRLVLAAYPVRSTQILIVNVYLPSGGSEAVVKDRRACLSDLHTELSTYGDVPVVVTADWNLEISDNPLVLLLLQKGWHLPLVTGPGEGTPYSYKSGSTSTLIDYCLCSRRIPVASQAIQMNPTQHQLLTLELPASDPMKDLWEVPRPVHYPELKKPNQSNRGIWERMSTVENTDVELVWKDWQDTFHLHLMSLCPKGPATRPGKVRFRKAQAKCRLTDNGGETEQAVVAYKLARRIAEHAQHPSKQLLQSILCTDLPKHLQAFSEQQLHAQPQHLVSSIREETGKYLKAVVQKRIKKWHQTLSDQAQNPSSHLYRWLKNEGPVGPVVLSVEGRPLQTMTQVFQAHREYWQQVCCHPNALGEQSRLQDFVRGASRTTSEPILGKEVLAAAQRTNYKSVGGLDSWSPSVLRALDFTGGRKVG